MRGVLLIPVLASALLACDRAVGAALVGERAERRMSSNQLYNLGLERLKGGDLSGCVRTYQEVLRRKRMAEAYANLGHCLFAQGPAHDAAALEAFTEAKRRAPGEAPPMLGRAAVFARRGELDLLRAERAELEEAGHDPELVDRIESGAVPPLVGAYEKIKAPRQAPLGIFGN